MFSVFLVPVICIRRLADFAAVWFCSLPVCRLLIDIFCSEFFKKDRKAGEVMGGYYGNRKCGGIWMVLGVRLFCELSEFGEYDVGCC